ncbi:hypothetical protein LG634_06655 [Streptomyces bambusae]|uniref:hypothetical protein n=1 Tax=Streptomyces bambusae TaxID=1550616 RepID=UPI001CFEB953|nr:hypothetical protein [Streptomyces bambusae]MCB5164515.1 hypothetical protein [Streptomyces bambusae]
MIRCVRRSRSGLRQLDIPVEEGRRLLDGGEEQLVAALQAHLRAAERRLEVQRSTVHSQGAYQEMYAVAGRGPLTFTGPAFVRFHGVCDDENATLVEACLPFWEGGAQPADLPAATARPGTPTAGARPWPLTPCPPAQPTAPYRGRGSRVRA